MNPATTQPPPPPDTPVVRDQSRSSVDRRLMLAAVAGVVGASLAGLGLVARWLLGRDRVTPRSSVAQTTGPGKTDPALDEVLAMLSWPDERFASASKLFVARAARFPSNERLSEGCRRLARMAFADDAGRDVAERDRIAVSALWGMRWLRAVQDLELTNARVRERGELVDAAAWIRRHASTGRVHA